jgi:hypothetical protein
MKRMADLAKEPAEIQQLNAYRDCRLSAVPGGRRRGAAVEESKALCCLWSVLTCRISWQTSERCKMALSARARMIGHGSSDTLS